MTTALLAACGGSDGLTNGSATLQSIQVSPAQTSLAIGATQQFVAIGTYSDSSTADLTTRVSWSSSNTRVASISNTYRSEGVATATGAGETSITANLSGIKGTTTLAVRVWTWMGGQKYGDASGIYGTQRAAASSNAPGARTQSYTWTDGDGNFWLYGGLGNGYQQFKGEVLDDLWVYSPKSRMWTWVGGQADAARGGFYGTRGQSGSNNWPGSRYAGVTWTDNRGKLWLFGGYGVDVYGNYGYLNDLWTYDTTRLAWTWMSGSPAGDATGVYGTRNQGSATNSPGARYGSTTWADARGNLWLFGGYGVAGNSIDEEFNDLWTYSTVTQQWTWIGGSSSAAGAGVHGARGASSTSYIPGARDGAVAWSDNSGKVWLFGGYGYDSDPTSPAPGYLSDLWFFDSASGSWTWVNGPDTIDNLPTFGVRGIAAANNSPGGRALGNAWVDADGSLWLFGGVGYNGANNSGPGLSDLADLWRYEPATNQWMWASGASAVNAAGVYGPQGVPLDTNAPGARSGAPSWTDQSGGFWLLGGLGEDADGTTTLHLNDLWRYY